MIKISFSVKGPNIIGFSVTGHGTTDSEDQNGKLVCSAVSSAVYLTANTLLEVVGAKADCTDNGETFGFSLLSKINESQVTLQGFKLHVTELSKDYKNKLTVSSEV